MKNIETTISQLVENQFPAFYKDEGPNFVAFVKAYYEWLEDSTQYLTLLDPTGFNVGNQIYQTLSDNVLVVGTIINKNGNTVGVQHTGLEMFRCIEQCGVIHEVTSSTGARTFIQISTSGGAIYQARNLANYKDIDTTIDRFILYFKEKYLKNIQFDTATNKKLLVKNSLDLYRAKGTERAIDLFFKLVYGTEAKVYYPGDDLFRVSDGEWVRPRYIEITSSDRAIDYVGKEITGIDSGATAFVERYIKRRVKDSTVAILYISNIRGEFVNNEVLKTDRVYPDSPKVVGSLTEVQVITGGKEFAVGDVVSFQSTKGENGTARVSEISNRTGVVDFLFYDGGFGYTLNAESIVSEKVITVSNVVTSNTIDYITISSGGTGYSNADKILVQSPSGAAATGRVLTDGSGTIIDLSVDNPGSGFLTVNPSVTITNTTGGTANGTSANLVATTKLQDSYLKYFELLKQPLANATFESANADFSNNELLFTYHVNNAIAGSAKIINVTQTTGQTNGELFLSIVNGSINSTSVIYTAGNTKTATVNNYVDKTATGKIMGIGSNAQLTVQTTQQLLPNQVIYQTTSNGEISNAVIYAVGVAGGGLLSLQVSNVSGVFVPSLPVQIRSSNTTATLVDTSLTIGVYDITNAFYSNVYAYTTNTSITATVLSTSFGTGAGFDVFSLGEVETIFLGTDLVGSNNVSWVAANLVSMANQSYMSLPIANYAYGFPKNPQGNSADIIYSCLDFQKFDIGVISSLTGINPGADYNVDPYVLVYEPVISAFDRNDYIFSIENATGTFVPGERILQTSETLIYYELTVDDETGFTVGEAIYQGTPGSETANAVIVDIFPANNIIKVNNVQGTLANSTSIYSRISTANTNVQVIDQVTETSTAKGIVKAGSNSSILYVKRISFNNTFDETKLIVGTSSGVTANIVSIEEDETVRQIGLNANVEANVVTANGSVTALQVIDSGFGYANSEVIEFVSEGGDRQGQAKAIVSGSGTGAGYWKSTKGFLSADKFIHDSDYYQEYSYEILTKLPFEKYAEIFKRTMHTAGTRVFGSVVITEEANVTMTVSESSTVQTLYERVQFNSNSSVLANGAITFDNDYANTQLVFSNGEKVIYEALGGNTVVQPLANAAFYYVAEANTTGIKLVTNPRTIQQYFNANSDVGSNFITLTRHMFANNDVVKYTTSTGNTAITGLSNNGVYHVVAANSTGIKLANTRGGTALSITAGSTSENGHLLAITTINITANSTNSGASTNGHFLTLASEY